MRKRNTYVKYDTEKIIQIPILDYASASGYTVTKVGKSYSLKEHDSVRIDAAKNKFIRNSNGKAGNIISFVMEFENKDYVSALKQLSEITNGSSFNYTPQKYISSHKPEKKEEKPILKLPKKVDTTKNVMAYLSKSRGIDMSIIQEFISNGNLYQDENNNCVFVSKDTNNKPNFINKRGTNTFKRFISDVAGSDYNHCFYINNNAPAMIVTESVIDSMSIMSTTLHNKKSPKSFNYLALSGASKITAVETHIKENSNINTVIICFDNDEAGRKNAVKIHELLKPYDLNIIDKFPQEKDWNDELLKREAKKKQSQALSNDEELEH